MAKAVSRLWQGRFKADPSSQSCHNSPSCYKADPTSHTSHILHFQHILHIYAHHAHSALSAHSAHYAHSAHSAHSAHLCTFMHITHTHSAHSAHHITHTVVRYQVAGTGNRRPKQCSTRAVKRFRWLAANRSLRSVKSVVRAHGLKCRPEHTGSLWQGVAIRAFCTHSKLVNLQSASPTVHQLPTVAYLCTDA